MPDLGTKHECTSCSTKFYDLGRAAPVCPKCGLNQLADEEEPVVEEPPKEAEVVEKAAEDKAVDAKKDGDGEETADDRDD